MRSKIILFIILLCAMVNFAWADAHRAFLMNPVKEDGRNIISDNKAPVKFTPLIVVDTSGRIPTMTNFYDYRTNGNNLRGLWVFGDTIIVSADLVDSANASISTARNSFYQASFDGGLTWFDAPIQVSALGNAYPDIDPVIITGVRTVCLSGRQFVSGARGCYIADDAQLGAGSITSYLVDLAQEDFTMQMDATHLAGGYESRTTDSLFFTKFDFTTNTYSGRTLLAVATDGINANARSYTAANLTGKVAIAWWDGAAIEEYVRVSTDFGATFGSTVHVVPNGSIVNGDAVEPWLAADIMFSPTGNLCMAISTIEPGNLGTPRGSKLIFWSPAINSGNAVVIVDYHNAPSNSMLTDTTYYDNHYSSNNQQTGMTAFSHPSLAYSSDGSMLFCVYNVVQRDTADYRYFFNDICESYSTDNGATWSAPVKLTNTPQTDEIYAIISKTGCTPSNIAVTYQLSAFPGSYSFQSTTNPSPDGRVYNIFKRFDPVTGNEITIGIINISNEVPAHFILNQNYPNPFNPSTKIRFALPKTANVTLRVYNSLGQVVATLVNNERVEAGTKEVTFDASKYASGIYFYTMSAGDFTQTKKMILLK
jgi:hypothetical protein